MQSVGHGPLFVCHASHILIKVENPCSIECVICLILSHASTSLGCSENSLVTPLGNPLAKLNLPPCTFL